MEYASHLQEAHMNPAELLSPITSKHFESDAAAVRGMNFTVQTRNNSNYLSSLHRPESELGCPNIPYSLSISKPSGAGLHVCMMLCVHASVWTSSRTRIIRIPSL